MEVGVSHILPLSIKDAVLSLQGLGSGSIDSGPDCMCSTSVIKQMLLRIEVFSEKMMFSVFLLAVC